MRGPTETWHSLTELVDRVMSWLALVIAGLWLVPAPAYAQEAIPGWHTNLDEARRAAERTGKPLFITFRCVR